MIDRLKIASAAAFALCACSTVPVVSGQTADAPSVLTGAYTEAQAIDGQTLYNTQCWMCHGESLLGQDQASPLVGPQFAANWEGEPLRALADRIDTMPPDRPGSLSREEIAATLSYILWYNGLPIGETALSAEPGVLSKMTFQTPPLPDQ